MTTILVSPEKYTMLPIILHLIFQIGIEVKDAVVRAGVIPVIICGDDCLEQPHHRIGTIFQEPQLFVLFVSGIFFLLDHTDDDVRIHVHRLLGYFPNHIFHIFHLFSIKIIYVRRRCSFHF